MEHEVLDWSRLPKDLISPPAAPELPEYHSGWPAPTLEIASEYEPSSLINFPEDRSLEISPPPKLEKYINYSELFNEKKSIGTHPSLLPSYAITEIGSKSEFEQIINTPVYRYQQNNYIEIEQFSPRPYELSNKQIITESYPSEQLNQQYKLTPAFQKTLAAVLARGNGNASGKQINAEDLPTMALPVVEFMKEVQPHIVVGCDRGGRMYSLAVHGAWRQVTEGEPFPTLDGKIHFARISTTENEAALQGQFDRLVAAAKAQARMSGQELPDDEQLRVLFIDDWVCGGDTRRLTQRLASSHGARSYFAVMRGDGADVSGMPGDNQAKPGWSDDGTKTGVNYVTEMTLGPDGQYYEAQTVHAIRSEEARQNRQRLQSAVAGLALTPTTA